MKILDRHMDAFYFAVGAHSQTQKYGNYPYIYHLIKVYEVGVETGYGESEKFDDEMKGMLLHDVMEDTHHNYADVKKHFNVRVADIVITVSDGTFKNRKLRKKEAWPRLREFSQNDSGAIIVKSADIIANLRQSILDIDDGVRRGLSDLYIHEVPGFIEEFKEFMDPKHVDLMELAVGTIKDKMGLE